MDQQGAYAGETAAAGFFVGLLFVVGSAVIVYVDARRIGVRKGLVTGIADNSAGMWAIGVALMWILVVPIYLANRVKLKAAAADARAGDRRQRVAPTGYRQPTWSEHPAWDSPYPWGRPHAAGPAPTASGPTNEPPNTAPLMPPAGWYQDPERSDGIRWWDGQRWTEHRTPNQS